MSPLGHPRPKRWKSTTLIPAGWSVQGYGPGGAVESDGDMDEVPTWTQAEKIINTFFASLGA